MIQINELRIGNFIYDDENQVVKVERIESQYFNQENEPGAPLVIFSKHGHGLWESDVINPIPLTEEMLIKCGFELIDGWYQKHNIKLFNIRGLYFRASFPIKADIIHIHQLQNLIYALTGEELEVNL